MPFYVYMTVNSINNHKYIGKRHCKCEIDQDRYLGSGTAITNAIKKYGSENFFKIILEQCSSYEECNEREKFWIKKYDAVNDKTFYNIASGGEGGNTYAGLSESELSRIRKIKRQQTSGKNNPHYNADVSDETRKRISESLKKLYSVPENCSRYGRFGADNPCSKHIHCIELDMDFCGIREASRQMGIPPPNITRALRDPTRYSAGKHNGQRLHWEYCEDKNEG